jgi:nucleotide-binding universal stress UspA family protein
MAPPILVGFDPRTTDRAPVRLGVLLARLTEARLIVAAVQRGLGPRAIAMSNEQALPFAIVQPDQDLVADCAPQIEEIRQELEPYGLPVECEMLFGTSAASALHEAVEEHGAGLLVVGSSARAHRGRVLAGSTAQRLLAGSPCPVAVAPAGWEGAEAPRTIGVGYRDTVDGREALRAALLLARRSRARLRIVTVVEDGLRAALEAEPAQLAGRRGTTVDDVIGEYQLSARKAAQAALDEMDPHHDVDSEVESWTGEPADVLIGLTHLLGMLVCGSRGYGPVRAVLLGAVSRRIVAEAQCPVVVVPRGGGPRLDLLVDEAARAGAPT